jgi:indole-3-glycerol phosphate synthase
LIAECKRRPRVAAQVRSGAIGADYAENGAAALSVLTDEKFFQGALSDLTMAHEVAGLPALRKDFIVDGYQVVKLERRVRMQSC